MGKMNKPVMYACTHIGCYNIETGLQLVRKHCYFLMGDPGAVYKSFDEFKLYDF